MKQGLTVPDMVTKLKTDKARMKDYVVDTRELHVLTSTDTGRTEVKLPGLDELDPTQHFLRQLGTDLGVRADLFDRLRGKHPVQFDHLVNGLLDRWSVDHNDQPGKRLVRTYADGGSEGQGIARAVMSDRYRRIDNLDIVLAVAPIIEQIPNARIESCNVNENRLYLKVIAPLTEVDLRDLIQPGVHEFYSHDDPDAVLGGFVLSNSETGRASLDIQQLLFRVRCKNGLITESLLRRAHIGGRLTADDDGIVYREETLAADDRALMMKVQDAVAGAVDDVRFRQLAAQFAETITGQQIERPVEAMKTLAPTVGLGEAESQAILEQLLMGGDKSRFGLINAITRAAQNDDFAYDRSTEMEEIGGTLLRMPDRDWAAIATATA